MRTLTVENFHNLSTHWIIEIFSILYSSHVVFRDQDKFVFYINNSIDWDQFNPLYDLDQMAKSIRNANVVANKLGPNSRNATNYRLEVGRKEQYQREKIVERQNKEAMVAKGRTDRKRISLSNGDEVNHKSDTGDDTDPA